MNASLMNQTLTTWLLAGALATSLVWNFRPVRGEAGLEGCGTCATGASSCSAAIDALDLSPEQRSQLSWCSATMCKQSSQSESRASELAAQLFDMLAQPEVDAARVRQLAQEVGTLRGKALSECVDSMLEVRRVLTPEQLRELLTTCCKAK
jgi:Spy/CpxP family protein refolding chaperone